MATAFKIGAKTIGKDMAPFIIAEAGINHNGEVGQAKKMIVTAKEAGVDAVKFQTFRTEEFIQDKSEMYTYQSQGKEVTESQYEMFKRTEFSEDGWRNLTSSTLTGVDRNVISCSSQNLLISLHPSSENSVRLNISVNTCERGGCEVPDGTWRGSNQGRFR